MYKVKYTGNGQIEVNLPSYPAGVIIKHNDYAKIKLSVADKKVIDSLRKLGLFYEEIEDKAPVIEKVEKEVEIENPQPEVVEVVNEDLKKDTNPPKYTKEELMRKTAGDLKGILKDLGEENFDKQSKSNMSDRILEIINDRGNN